MTKKSSLAVTDITQNFTQPPEGAKPAEELLAPTPPPAPVTVTHEKMIASAINKVKSIVKSCVMTGKVNYGKTKYPYANENDVITALRQTCVDVGLVAVPSYVSHEVNSKGDVTCIMAVKLTHTSGAVWPYDIKTAGTCGQGNILGAQTSAMRVWYLKTFHLYTGDDPELITQGLGESGGKVVETPYVTSNKDIVLKNIMKQFPGASEEARDNRLSALNAELLGINGDPVNSPDQVAVDQWAKIVEKLK